MSFSKTTRQVRNGTKTVTRRVGWDDLQPGEQLWACEKCQGLKKGEKVVRIRVIEVVSTRKERLDSLLRAIDGQYEVDREGFPWMTPREFVEMFCREIPRARPGKKVNRIEFRYIGKVYHEDTKGTKNG